MLADIAVLTGGTVISEEVGRKLDTATIDDMGRADRITATKDSSVIVGGKGTKEQLKPRPFPVGLWSVYRATQCQKPFSPL